MAAFSAPQYITASMLELSQNEQGYFDQLFRTVDKPGAGRVTGAQIKDLFTSSNLPKKTLADIWNLANQQQLAFLTRDDFYVALRLIALAQQGKPLSKASLLQFKSPSPPVFQGLALAPAIPASSLSSSALSMGPPGLGPSLGPLPGLGASPSPSSGAGLGPALGAGPGASGGGWGLSDAERAQYVKFFPSADKDGDGLVSGKEANVFFRQSNLDTAVLKAVWNLSDLDRDGALNSEEFSIAMHLIMRVRKGIPLPPSLPQELDYRIRSSRGGGLGGIPPLVSQGSGRSLLGEKPSLGLPKVEPQSSNRADILDEIQRPGGGGGRAYDDLLAPVKSDDPPISLGLLDAPKPTPAPIPSAAPSHAAYPGQGPGLLPASSSTTSSSVSSVSSGFGFGAPQPSSAPSVGLLGFGGGGGGGGGAEFALRSAELDNQGKLVKETLGFSQQKLLQVDDERAQFAQKLTEKAEELNQEAQKLREIQGQLAESSRSLAQTRDMLEQKRSEAEEMKRQKEIYEAQFNNNKRAAIEMKAEIDTIEQELTTLRQMLKSAEDMKQSQESTLLAWREKQASLRRERADITELLEKARMELAQLKQSSELLKQSLPQQAEGVAALKEQLQETLTIIKEEKDNPRRPPQTASKSQSSVSTLPGKSSGPNRAESENPPKLAPTTAPVDKNFMNELDAGFSNAGFGDMSVTGNLSDSSDPFAGNVDSAPDDWAFDGSSPPSEAKHPPAASQAVAPAAAKPAAPAAKQPSKEPDPFGSSDDWGFDDDAPATKPVSPPQPQRATSPPAPTKTISPMVSPPTPSTRITSPTPTPASAPAPAPAKPIAPVSAPAPAPVLMITAGPPAKDKDAADPFGAVIPSHAPSKPQQKDDFGDDPFGAAADLDGKASGPIAAVDDFGSADAFDFDAPSPTPAASPPASAVSAKPVPSAPVAAPQAADDFGGDPFDFDAPAPAAASSPVQAVATLAPAPAAVVSPAKPHVSEDHFFEGEPGEPGAVEAPKSSGKSHAPAAASAAPAAGDDDPFAMGGFEDLDLGDGQKQPGDDSFTKGSSVAVNWDFE